MSTGEVLPRPPEQQIPSDALEKGKENIPPEEQQAIATKAQHAAASILKIEEPESAHIVGTVAKETLEADEEARLDALLVQAKENALKNVHAGKSLPEDEELPEKALSDEKVTMSKRVEVRTFDRFEAPAAVSRVESAFESEYTKYERLVATFIHKHIDAWQPSDNERMINYKFLKMEILKDLGKYLKDSKTINDKAAFAQGLKDELDAQILQKTESLNNKINAIQDTFEKKYLEAWEKEHPDKAPTRNDLRAFHQKACEEFNEYLVEHPRELF